MGLSAQSKSSTESSVTLAPDSALIPTIVSTADAVVDPLVAKSPLVEFSAIRPRRAKKTKVPASDWEKEQSAPALSASKFTNSSVKKPDVIVSDLNGSSKHGRKDSTQSPQLVGGHVRKEFSTAEAGHVSPDINQITLHGLLEGLEKPFVFYKDFETQPILDIDSEFSDDDDLECVWQILPDLEVIPILIVKALCHDDEVLAFGGIVDTAAQDASGLVGEEVQGPTKSTPDTDLINLDCGHVPKIGLSGICTLLENCATDIDFFKRIAISSREDNIFDDILDGNVLNTTIMVRRVTDASKVNYSEGDMGRLLRLVDSLDVYHHTTLPKVVHTQEQFLERKDFDLAMSKHRDDLARYAAREGQDLAAEVAPQAAKVVKVVNKPQTMADADMEALFAMGTKAITKNGTWYPSPYYQAQSDAPVCIMDVEEDPAIVSLSPLLAVCPIRTVNPLVDGLALAITCLRSNEAAKAAMKAAALAAAPAPPKASMT